MASGVIWGSFTGVSTDRVRPYIQWSSTPNSSTNQSSITATLVFVKYNATYYSYNKSMSNTSNIDGSTSPSNNAFNIGPKGTAPIYSTVRSRTVTVTHNADGTRTCWIGWSGQTGTSLGNFDFGATVTLDTIAKAPTVTTNACSNVNNTSFTASGTVTGDGYATVTSRGFCYSSSNSNPTLADSYKVVGSGTGWFSTSITGLSAGTTYYIRSFATNSAGTGYGNVVTQATTYSAPTVTTNAVTNIDKFSATLNGNVNADNGSAITERGFVYSTTTNPVIGGGGVVKQTVAGTTGAYSYNASSLSAKTTYYVKAYATNEAGTSYGSQTSFETLSAAPSVTSTGVTNLVDTTATLGGNVTADNGSTITERGVCYSTSENPTTANNKQVVSGTTGSYTKDITGLTAATTYHYRAFATNAYGTSYGSDVAFRTQPSKVTSFLGTVTGKTTIDLSWVKGVGSTYTIIRRKAGSYPANAWDGIGVYSGTGTTTTDTGLSAGTAYYYRAWARDGADNYSRDAADLTKTTHYGLTNPEEAYEEDSVYATAPANDNKVYVKLSKDGGTTWSNELEATLPSSNGTVSFGSSGTELWGFMTLNGDDVDDTSFRLKITLGSNKTSYQTYKNFGFTITPTYLLTGIEVNVKGYHSSETSYIDGISVKCRYGTSVLPIKAGSQAFDSTTGKLVFFDGTNWKQVATT